VDGEPSWRLLEVTDDKSADYYEVLQVSSNAEQETIQRVFRMLARRYHPDNKDTGDERRFREIQEAYSVLNDAERRARYDIGYEEKRNNRWRLVSTGTHAENDFEIEQMVRLTALEALYTKRRVEPRTPAIYLTELEMLLGRPREHLEFTIWYLVQRKHLTRDDQSGLMITAEGVDYLEQNYKGILQRRRLHGMTDQC
jgi:curved DNA-binding protein CbpA